MSALPELEQRGDDVMLRVRATPGASRDDVAGVVGGALKVQVTAAPEKGKANRAIGKVLAKALGLRASQVVLRSGETSRDKWFTLRGADLEAIETKLRGLVA